MSDREDYENREEWPKDQSPVSILEWRKKGRREHQKAVLAAIRSGKPVPAEVLAEVKKAGTTPNRKG